MHGGAAIAFGLVLAAVVPAPSSARTCDLCQMRLTHRTGPYRIVLNKEGAWLPKTAPRFRVTIINGGPRRLVVGDAPPASRIVLNSVVTYAGGGAKIRAPLPGLARTVAPRSRATLHARYTYGFDKPGVYRFNVSYGAVDSNILTYKVN
ncbi:MAG: hypothetical protein QOF71_2194 [Candidatus Eremiobacteraeota bacterium]|jgi:hypothetical protein|nr:hypothetical protein [Candidatus Eremiobacteraeota bacterium]